MKIFNNQQFKELSNRQGEYVISIYTPTRRHSTDAYQADKTHFKNQLTKVENELVNNFQVGNSEAEKILRPAKELLKNHEFWKFNTDMLAYFIIDGEEQIYQLPLEIQDGNSFIGKRPFMLPLIPEINDDGHFYLLLLNLDRIRLYEATRNKIREVELDPEEIAVSFIAEEEEEENIKTLQGKSGVGQAGVMFHGHGDGSDEEKKVTVLNYFHRMTNMLEPKLNNKPLPLYLAGVDYLIPLFHQASKYNFLQKGHVSGAYNGEGLKTLHKNAWELAAPYFSQEREKRQADYSLKVSKNLAIDNDKSKLIKAALTGGVDTLFVNSLHKHLWGTFDESGFKIRYDNCPTGKNHCLIDLAASAVIQNNGKVYLLDPEEMPEDAPVKGTLRYEI